MSKVKKRPSGRLLETVMALEEELGRMGAVAREAQRLPLNSEQNLERTQEKMAELGTVDEKLQPLVSGLMAAVSEMVQEQQAQAAVITARAEELQRRREVFQQLMAGYAAVGRATQQLNGFVQAYAAARKEDGAAPAEAPSLEIIQASFAQLIESVKEVFQAARQNEFEDIARQADLLKQQLLSARNKLNLLPAGQEAAGTLH